VPTVLDLLDRPIFDAAQGHSLVPLAQGVTGGYPMPSYASQYEYAHAMRLGDWKLRVGRPDGIVLYDLVGDPEEMTDVARTRPIERRFMTDAMLLFLQYRGRWNKRAWGVAGNMTERAACELIADQREQRPRPSKKARPKKARPEKTDDADDADDEDDGPCAAADHVVE
jgi:hypothetical protein